MTLFSGIIDRLRNSEKARRAVVVVGVVLMLVLLLSTFFSGENADGEDYDELSAAEIEQSLEERLTHLISCINGVGDVAVMITLDTTSERVYVQEVNSSSDIDDGSESSRKETTLALTGGKEAVEKSVIQPKVRGVAVVCTGADDPTIRERITRAVAGVLDISVSQVYVTG